MKPTASRFLQAAVAMLATALSASTLGQVATPAAGKARVGGAAHDPAKVVGPEKCGECHKTEFAAWQQTHHAKTFLEMHRKPEAAEIVRKLGGSRIKQNEHCLTCHYTQGLKEGEPAALWGVTCESCHGLAKPWMGVHYDLGGETETPEHRKTRLEQITALGMFRPADTYNAAANCYGCHTVPDEELVNKGGHKPRSAFELVSWSQGEVRHNFFYSPDKKNRPATAAHKRVLYVVGEGLDLEYSLRAASKATTAGSFVDNAAKSIAGALAKLKEIQAAQTIPEVAEMIAAAATAAPKAGDAAALARAADAVSAANQKFAKANDGEKLASIDKLLPAPDTYRGAGQP